MSENNLGDDDSAGSVDTEGVFLEMFGLPTFDCVSSVVADDDENDNIPSVKPLIVPQNCSRYLHDPSDVASILIQNFLNVDECQEMIHLANTMSSTGFHYVTEAAHTDEDGITHIVKLQEANKHKLSVFEHTKTTQKLWNRLERIIMPHISTFIDDTNCGKPIGLNPRLRVLRYDASDADVFDPHFDATTRVKESTSLLTVLIYLNDGGGKEFDGGETCFLDAKSMKLNEESAMVTPSSGDVVVFEHDLFHSSAPLKFGTKYILRTDVLFQFDQEGGVELPRGESKDTSENVAVTLFDVCQQLSVCDEVKNALGDIGLIDLTVETFFNPGEVAVKSILRDVLDDNTADIIFQAAMDCR